MLLYYLMVFLLAFRGIDVFGIKTGDVVVALVFVTLAMTRYVRGGGLVADRRFMVLFLCFYVAMALSLFAVQDFTYSKLDPFRYAVCAMIFIVVTSVVTDRERFAKSVLAVLAGGVVSGAVSVTGLLLWLHGTPVAWMMHEFAAGEVEGRMQPFFPDPNHYAAFLLIPTLLSTHLLVRAYREKRWTHICLGVLALAILVGGIVSTGSRGGVVALAAGLTVALTLYLARSVAQQRPPQMVSVGLVVAAAGAYGAHLLLPRASVVLDLLRFSSLRTGGLEASIGIRMELWKGALHAFLEHPVIGVGTGNYVNIWPQLAAKYGLTTPRAYFPHNSYLDLLAEMGILGFASGIALLIYVYQKAVPKTWAALTDTITVALFAALVAESVHMLTLSMFSARPLWFLFGLIFAYANLDHDRCEGGLSS